MSGFDKAAYDAARYRRIRDALRAKRAPTRIQRCVRCREIGHQAKTCDQPRKVAL